MYKAFASSELDHVHPMTTSWQAEGQELEATWFQHPGVPVDTHSAEVISLCRVKHICGRGDLPIIHLAVRTTAALPIPKAKIHIHSFAFPQKFQMLDSL